MLRSPWRRVGMAPFSSVQQLMVRMPGRSAWLVAALCVAAAGAAAVAPVWMQQPLPVAVIWCVGGYVTLDACFRWTSRLVPTASMSVFLLAFGLLAEAFASGTVAVLGSVGWFRLPVVASLLAVVHLGVRRGGSEPRPLAQLLGDLRVGRRFEPIAAAAVVVFLALVGLVVLNQVRYTVQDADSMWYHLPMAGEYVRTGSIRPVEAVPLIGRAYPGFRQAILAFLSLASGNEHLALIGGLESAMLAAAVYAVARAFAADAKVAIAAAVYAATTPVVAGATSTQGNDISLAVHLLLAVLFGSRWLATGARGEAWLAGLALGALATTKFSGPGYAVAILGVLVVQHGWRQLRAARGRVHLAVAAALVAGPWFGRNLLVYGNPLYPARLMLGGQVVFDGPLASDYFAPTTLGWNVAPLFAAAHQFVEAHGVLAVLGVLAPVVVLLGVLLRRTGLRSSLAMAALPTALFAAFLHHPFNQPGFGASYIHRYLIGWYSISMAALAVGLSAWPWLRRPAAMVLLLGVACSAGEATRFAVPVLVATVVATVGLCWPRLRVALDAFGDRVVRLRLPPLLVVAAAIPAVYALQVVRADSQYDPDYGWHDPASDRGWGPACAWVHRHVAGSRIGLHGSIYFFPLLGEPFSNDVYVADDLHLDVPRLTPAAVVAWVEANQLDYLVCCVPRLDRTGAREFAFGTSIAAELLAARPDRFESVFAARGSQVLRVRRG